MADTAFRNFGNVGKRRRNINNEWIGPINTAGPLVPMFNDNWPGPGRERAVRRVREYHGGLRLRAAETIQRYIRFWVSGLGRALKRARARILDSELTDDFRFLD